MIQETMTQETDILTSLIEHTRDSVNGYEEAATLVEDERPELARLFRERATGRRRLLDMLCTNLRAVDAGNDVLQSDGTAMGDLHQAFMQFRSLFQDDSKAALSEVERGESYLVECYEEALNDAPPSLHGMISECLQMLKRDERTVEALHAAA